jgi:hypothetical protein
MFGTKDIDPRMCRTGRMLLGFAMPLLFKSTIRIGTEGFGRGRGVGLCLLTTSVAESATSHELR